MLNYQSVIHQWFLGEHRGIHGLICHHRAPVHICEVTTLVADVSWRVSRKQGLPGLGNVDITNWKITFVHGETRYQWAILTISVGIRFESLITNFVNR